MRLPAAMCGRLHGIIPSSPSGEHVEGRPDGRILARHDLRPELGAGALAAGLTSEAARWLWATFLALVSSGGATLAAW